MEDTLRDTTQLVAAQRHDPNFATAAERARSGARCVLADDDLLWHAPRGRAYAIAVPKHLVPGVLALVHGTYRHPGVARTTILVERKYHWPTLKKDVRTYVLSCKCRRRKRAWSKQLFMMPARLLQPWEVLEMDLQDMKVTSAKGNRYLLVVVDRASKFLSAFPLPAKDAIGISRKLLDLLLVFGLPLSIRSDPGGEFVSEVMKHLCCHIDTVAQALDDASLGQGLERTVADQQRMTQKILKQWHEAKNKLRGRHNARVARGSPGAKAAVGDYVLVKEPDSTLHRDSHHPKLTNDHYTGPWKVINAIRDRLSFTVQLNGRKIRQRRVAAADVKPYHRRPDHLRLPFEDEFSHLVWSADLGLADTSIVAVPLYTLVDRRVVHSADTPSAWTWEYQGRFQDGTLSPWLTYDEASDSFSPLQLDVFHALYEDYHGANAAPRPAGPPTRGAREVASREHALQLFPIGTPIGREFVDSEGHPQVFKAAVFDYCDPYWRVDYPDGDWEDLTRREMDAGVGVAARPSFA
eukprot:g3715.t1